ncbi:MAG: SDR family NAD(P)-dependent oxidoreductase, partial [Candidatus Omnitrophota bacterium]
MLFKDKVAIVTGGSRGIGRAIVLMLAAEGADVVFTYNKSVSEAEALAAEVERLKRKAIALQMDVRDFAKARELIEKAKEGLGRLD